MSSTNSSVLQRFARLLFGIALLAAVYLALTWSLYTGLASRVPGANDYYSRWMGARLFFLDGQDPYLESTTQKIQLGMYARLAQPEEDQVAFAYPLYAAFFALPFIGLPYAWAESFWMALLILLLWAGGIAAALMMGWKISPLRLLGLLIFVQVFYPSLRAIMLGQYAVIVFASIAFGLFLLDSGRDGWAGLILAASVVKPHVALLPLLIILAWAIAHRRRRLLYGLAGGLALLVMPATLLLPTWPLEFEAAVEHYHQYITIGPPLQVLCQILLPGAGGNAVFLVGTGLGLAVLGLLSIRTVGAPFRDYLPTIELALLLTTSLMVRTATTDQTLLLLPWLHWLGARNQPARSPAPLLAAVALLAVPWSVFIATLNGNTEAAVATAIVPLLTGAGFLVFYGSRWLLADSAARVEDAA